ncbi:acetyl-coenzyme A synthetase N-terminal domain-containing protein, partial [Thermus scotoductus]|uniref:acetyl-coenzyme A synthetase N-terminal domain-containing protein n=1 Tax=Thermus scotoductus TaxID=37636 RepID=UPI003F5123C7
MEPPRELLEKANLQHFPALYRQSLEDPEGFWGDFAQKLLWARPWEKVYDAESRAWFQGGLTNAALNALDRHLPERAQQVALLTLDGEGTLEKWTYRELHDLSARLAGVLKDLG